MISYRTIGCRSSFSPPNGRFLSHTFLIISQLQYLQNHLHLTYLQPYPYHPTPILGFSFLLFIVLIFDFRDILYPLSPFVPLFSFFSFYPSTFPFLHFSNPSSTLTSSFDIPSSPSS